LIEYLPNAFPGLFDGSGRGLADQCLQLREHLLDRVQIRAVGRQKDAFRPGVADRSPDFGVLVTSQIVHDNDVAGAKCWYETLSDPGQEADLIDGLVKNTGGLNAIAPETGDEGQCFPVPVWYFRDQALPDGSPTSDRGHVGFGPGLINEHQPPGIDLALMASPEVSLTRDVGTVLLAGVKAFF
jgi:hypothetical protein